MAWQPELPLLFPGTPPTGESARTIALGDRVVPYVLRRARRRTIGLTIDHRGLRVGAPLRAPLSEVEALLVRHAEWIAQKLDAWRPERHPPPLRLQDGTRLPYLGGPLEIRIDPTSPRAYQWTMAHDGIPVRLTLRSHDPASGLEAALRQRAREYFGTHLARRAQELGLALPRLALSSARTRWGSCSTRSGIRLNWRLIHCAPHIVDYVIVHELAHLREMNHSPRFWAIVAHHCPDYRTMREALKQISATLPAW